MTTYILQTYNEKSAKKMEKVLRRKRDLYSGHDYVRSTWILGMGRLHVLEFKSKESYRKSIRVLKNTTFWENITKKRIT